MLPAHALHVQIAFVQDLTVESEARHGRVDVLCWLSFTHSGFSQVPCINHFCVVVCVNQP
jgi:hypothetical protein